MSQSQPSLPATAGASGAVAPTGVDMTIYTKFLTELS